MSQRSLRLPLIVIGGLLCLTSATWARQNVVRNGSIELGEGASAIDPQVAADWTEVGVNIERSATVNLAPAEGGWALKAFGDSGSTSVGGSQLVSGIAAGNSVTASVWLYTPNFDKLGGSGEAGLVLEFVDMFGGTITIQQIYPLNESSAADTWIQATIGPVTAPANTAKARITCRLKWNSGDVFGAAYWDDVQLAVGGGLNLVSNGDFEIAGHSPGQSSVGIDEWAGFNDQQKSEPPEPALDGEYSARLGVREAYNGLYQFMKELAPNDHLLMRAWVLNPSAAPLSGTSRAGTKLEWQETSPPAEEYFGFDATDPQNTWVFVGLNTTVPDGAGIARITLIYGGVAGETGAVYFEDAYATTTGNPSNNLLTNASFESGFETPTDWTVFEDATLSCDFVYRTGDCSTRVAGTSYAGLWQEVSVTPGQSFDVGVYIQSWDFEPIVEAGTVAGIKVEWFAGGIPADIDIGAQGNEIDASAPTDTWIPLTIEYTLAPTESAVAQFTLLSVKGTGLTGYAYFDGCEAVLLNVYDGSDVDGDDDEDLADAAWLQRTFTGAGAAILPFNGITFDFDDNGSIQFSDYQYFEPRMTGPQ